METIFGAATPMDVKTADDPEDIPSEKKDYARATCIERSDTSDTT